MDLRELLNLIACPKCKGDLELDREERFYICKSCKLAYPIDDGIPVLLIDKAFSIEKMGGGLEE
ncbi:MAG: Trm112 family protein [Synergistetes bacterium]|nr:Trm112 family protein [Synergistota bacterium]MDW8193164.1 Trm112 family protein [Synergistota bacterium]